MVKYDVNKIISDCTLKNNCDIKPANVWCTCSTPMLSIKLAVLRKIIILIRRLNISTSARDLRLFREGFANIETVI